MGKYSLLLAVKITSVILLITLFYSFYIEPYLIEITHHKLKGDVKSPIKIIQLSDVHTRDNRVRESMILNKISTVNPDLIVVTGDTIADNGTFIQVKSFLKNLHAPLGVILIRGNWEHIRPGSEEISVYKSAGIKFLNNDSIMIRDDFWVTGIDEVIFGQPDLKKAISNLPQSGFRLGLIHSPIFIEQINGVFDLVLAGHTHGGQVRIPFIGPFFVPPGSGKYVQGWYEVNKSKLYVSRGLGNSLLDIRFNCLPEISVFEIVPD